MTTGMDRTRTPISVVIATRGRPAALARCLDAIFANDAYPGEIIVVDQSDGDESIRICRNYDGWSPSVTVIHHAGRGMAAAQNIGFRRTTLPVVAVTDDDCVPKADWIATIDRCMAETSTPAGVTGRVLPLDPVDDKMFSVATRSSTARAQFVGKDMPWRVGSGNNFAVRREWLVRVGGCDERLGPGTAGRGGADMDLFYRLLRAGARLHYEPDLLVYHERQTRSDRLARRQPYGYGMGACCGFYLRQRDEFAARMLATWLCFRLGRAFGGLRCARWLAIYEELLMLGGTAGGLWFGLRQPVERTLHANQPLREQSCTSDAHRDNGRVRE